jgi:hypothetical protein
MANNAEDEREWKVECIVKSEIRKEHGNFVTYFKVKWVDHKSKGWEPMEHVYTCPLLMKDLEKRSRKNLLVGLKPHQRRNEAITGKLGNFPAIPLSYRSNFTHPKESIPGGHETVQNILFEENDNGVLLWCVTFVGDPAFYFVRKAVMEYLFPQSSAYFHLERASKSDIIENVVAEHGE